MILHCLERGMTKGRRNEWRRKGIKADFVCDGAAQRRVHRWCLPSIPTAITTREEVAFFLHRVRLLLVSCQY